MLALYRIPSVYKKISIILMAAACPEAIASTRVEPPVLQSPAKNIFSESSYRGAELPIALITKLKCGRSIKVPDIG